MRRTKSVPERISYAVETLRRRDGLTYGQIADRIGVHENSLGRWRTVDRAINAENLRRLAEVTGFRYDWLLTGEGSAMEGGENGNNAVVEQMEEVIDSLARGDEPRATLERVTGAQPTQADVYAAEAFLGAAREWLERAWPAMDDRSRRELIGLLVETAVARRKGASRRDRDE